MESSSNTRSRLKAKQVQIMSGPKKTTKFRENSHNFVVSCRDRKKGALRAVPLVARFGFAFGYAKQLVAVIVPFRLEPDRFRRRDFGRLLIPAGRTGIRALPEIASGFKINGVGVDAVLTRDLVEKSGSAAIHVDLHVADKFVAAIRQKLVREDVAAAIPQGTGYLVLILDGPDASGFPRADNFPVLGKGRICLNNDDGYKNEYPKRY
jgi:hypothetical protein